MNIDIVNFARHSDRRQLQWFVGQQLPAWIQQMLQRKKNGADPGALIDEMASVCCVDESTNGLDDKELYPEEESEVKG